MFHIAHLSQAFQNKLEVLVTPLFSSLFVSLFRTSEQSNSPNINKYFFRSLRLYVVILSWPLIYGNNSSFWTRKTAEGLSQCTEFYLVAVDQSDKEKQ